MSKLGNIQKFTQGQTSVVNRQNETIHTVNYLMRKPQQEIIVSRRLGRSSGARAAYCKAAASTGATITCYLDYDATDAVAWSTGTYSKDDIVTYSGKSWRSIEDNNTSVPGVDGWAEISEITVNCELFEATNLSACFPSLLEGSRMPVYMSGGDWYSFWWFHGHEECA